MEKVLTQWRDIAVFVAGVVAALLPVYADPTGNGTLAVLVLGGLIGLSALWTIFLAGDAMSHWADAALGVLLFISPFVFGYTSETTAAYVSWIAGAVAVIVGLWAVLPTVRGSRTATP